MDIKTEIRENIWVIGKPRANLRCHDFSFLPPEGRTNVSQWILKRKGFQGEVLKTPFFFFFPHGKVQHFKLQDLMAFFFLWLRLGHMEVPGLGTE